MSFLRTLRAPAAVAGSYLATAKLTKAVVGNEPYEANTFWKVLAHVLPVRDHAILPSPAPWVYSREYLACLGRNMSLCLLPASSSSTSERVLVVTEDVLPEVSEAATTFSLWQVASLIAAKTPNVVDVEWATYAILDTMAQDLVSGRRGRLAPMLSGAWNGLEDDFQAFLEGEDAYLDAVKETAAPVAAAFSTTTRGDDVWEDDAFEENVRSQVHDMSAMLQRIAIKHQKELEHVMRISNDQARKLVRSNKKLRQAAMAAKTDARDVIGHNHIELLDAQEKVRKAEGAQKILTTENEGLEDQIRQLKSQAEQNANNGTSATAAHLLTTLGQAQDRNERLLAEIETSGRNLATTRGELAESNAKLTVVASQMETLNETVNEARKARDVAIDAKSALDEEYRVLGACWDDAEKAKEGAEEKLIEEREAHEVALSGLQAEKSKLSTNSVDNEQTIQNLEAEVERLKADKTSAAEARKNALSDLARNRSESEKTILELRDEIKKTEAENAESEQILDDRIDELQAEVSRADAEAHEAALAHRADITSLKGEVGALQEMDRVSAAKIETLERAKSTGLQDKAQLTTENEKLKDQVKDLQANFNGDRYNKLDKERSGLQRKLADQKQEILVAQGNARRLEHELTALQKQRRLEGAPALPTRGLDDKRDGDNDAETYKGSASKLPVSVNDGEAGRSVGSRPLPRAEIQPPLYAYRGPSSHGRLDQGSSKSSAAVASPPLGDDTNMLAARKEHRAAVEARPTGFGVDPGATTKSEDEIVGGKSAEELGQLPSSSFAQSTGPPKEPQHSQRGVYQGQAPPEAPKKPAAMLKKNKKTGRPRPELPAHLRNYEMSTPPPGGYQTPYLG